MNKMDACFIFLVANFDSYSFLQWLWAPCYTDNSSDLNTIGVLLDLNMACTLMHSGLHMVCFLFWRYNKARLYFGVYKNNRIKQHFQRLFDSLFYSKYPVETTAAFRAKTVKIRQKPSP